MARPRTPPLYATGKWNVKSPFVINADAIYTCQAIRSFDALRASGIDPYVSFYEPFNILREEYEQDVTNLANIVTLMSDTQPTVYVPDTYLLKYPEQTTIPYRHVVLSISLGAVPDTLALDDARQKMRDITLNSLGIESRVLIHQAGAAAEGVDQLTHQTLENNRLARIENNDTLNAQVISLERKNKKLLETNAVLVDTLKRHGLL